MQIERQVQVWVCAVGRCVSGRWVGAAALLLEETLSKEKYATAKEDEKKLS
jgi:hypothetical protein